MSRYGKIESGFWNSPKVQQLSQDAKFLMVYLLSCPHGNLVGCFVLRDGYVAADLAWPIETVRQTLCELFEKHLIERDEATLLVRIIGWWGHNTIENPNVATAAVKAILSLPNCEIKQRLIKSTLENDVFGQGVRETLSKALGKHFRNQEPNPTQQEPSQHMPADAGESAGLVTFPSNVVRIGAVDEIAKLVTGPPARPEPVPDRLVAKGRGSEIDADFVEWYEGYPRHVGRGKALKAYRSARKKASKETLLEAVRNGPRPEFSDQRYVPYPATWLNAERWADERGASSASSGLDKETTFPTAIYKGLL